MKGDDAWIIKLKAAGVSSDIIAAKLGLTEAEVDRRFADCQRQQEAHLSVGMVGLHDQFMILSHQYQLLGESLKHFAYSISKTVQLEDIRKQIVEGDPDATAENILRSFILFHPWEFVDPQESLLKSLRDN